MFLDKTNLRSTTLIAIVLVVAFALTGFFSSAYQREKRTLGRRHYSEGIALEKKGDLAAAVEEYRKALIFSPDDADYRISFAAALIGSGHLEEAESHIDQLLQEDPTNGVLNRMRAKLSQGKNNISQAIDYYQRAVYEYWPQDRLAERAQARWELIGLLEKAGRREESVGELMTLYANTTISPKSKIDIGFSLLKDGASSEAAQVFRDLIRAAPKDAEPHRGLGEAYLISGEYVSARHEFERALRLDPSFKAAASSLALTNAIIDMDPDLPGLKNSERLRRSQNLLKRVVDDLSECSGGIGFKDRAEEANNLMNGSKASDSDVPLQMRNLAQRLWSEQTTICPDGPPKDTPVSKVLDRMSRE